MKIYNHIKHKIDYLFAIVLLIILFPIFILITFYVFIFLGRPIIFKQKRPGLNAKPFEIYKFRSMAIQKDFSQNSNYDSMRLNKFGKFLRSTSLDELPSLINVLKGEMSFIGPRPLLMEYLDLYNEEQLKRHNVKPGITGLAQVSGRNKLNWEEKFKKDIYYVSNYNFKLDMKILFLTIWKVFLRYGINSKGDVTCYPFTGNNK